MIIRNGFIEQYENGSLNSWLNMANVIRIRVVMTSEKPAKYFIICEMRHFEELSDIMVSEYFDTYEDAKDNLYLGLRSAT